MCINSAVNYEQLLDKVKNTTMILVLPVLYTILVHIFIPVLYGHNIRERPFNLKGGGGYGVFSKKNILIPNVADKNILILVKEKK